MNIIWIHGFGEDSSLWKSFIPKFGGDKTNFLFDFSKTSSHNTIKGYSNDLADYILEKNIIKPVIIGHSMGGYIALEYAFNNPNSINGLGLFHSQAAGDSETKKEERDKTIAFIQKNGSEVFIRNFYPKMFTEESKATYNYLIAQNIERFVKINPEALCSATESMKNREDHMKSLSNFEFPIFQILGKKDSFVPLDLALNQTLLLMVVDPT